jgi:uncharacterized protein (TIGR02599 family)
MLATNIRLKEMRKQNKRGPCGATFTMRERYHDAQRKGFTLIEMMTAMVVLILIMVIALSMADATSRLSSQNTARLKSFQAARAAYEQMTRKLNQATLNTYWDYDNPVTPTAYKRQSELHFISGPVSLSLMQTVFANATNISTHAIFFQAPLGNVSNITNSSLDNLLNACGYYIQFGTNSSLPPFLQSVVPPTYRYRLMEWQPPSEKLGIYQWTSGNPNYDGVDWISQPSTSLVDNSYPLAENIIALVLLPMLSPQDASLPANPSTSLTTNYVYDSRGQPGTIPQPAIQNQLPPLVEVMMVAIDDTSAKRLANKHGTLPPPGCFKWIICGSNKASIRFSGLRNVIAKQSYNL